MKKSLKFSLQQVGIVLFAVACATTQSEGESKTQKKELVQNERKVENKKDKVPVQEILQPEEQKAIKEWLAKKPTQKAQAYCLFSYGGWGNKGQHCVATWGNKRVLYSKAAGEGNYVEKDISQKDFAAFTQLNQNAAKLKSIYKEAYDFIKYEYVEFDLSGKIVSNPVRVSIDHPKPETVSKQYPELIDGFIEQVEKLRK